MEAINDDTVIDNLSLCTTTMSTNRSSNSNNNQNHRRHHETATNKRSKRLPWNCEILRDRYTPQPYTIQLIERYLENSGGPNCLILAQNSTLKQYLILSCLKRQQESSSTKKLCLLVTHMGSCVSSQVELLSRHTTLKLAGIDKAFSNQALGFYLQLKRDAQLIIISINHLFDWFSFGLLTSDEIGLVLIESVVSIDAYRRLMDVLKTNNTSSLRIVGLGSLDIGMGGDAEAIDKHIETLKALFGFDVVETATDLLDTHNIFNGFEPIEVIEICDDENSSALTNEFTIRLIHKIKETFLVFDEFNANINEHSTTYIYQLCVRVLNECVYLLKEVGVWCLAKSLLPFICQLDKLAAYIVECHKEKDDLISSSTSNNIDPTIQQILTLQSTATLLREMREMCIKQILQSKAAAFNKSASFLTNFTTPKIQRLIHLLKSSKSDNFCCLIFVQNKQVATSLSLLLKKLAKEDYHSLGYLFPNYIIGSQTPNSGGENEQPFTTTSENCCIKQEEILKKFYSGEINLLVCTCEMERNIQSPSSVNLIVRYNCCSANSGFDYFTYIETKARAKSKQAYCHFYVDQSQFSNFFAQLNKFKQIENLLMCKYSQLIALNKLIVSQLPTSSNSKLTLNNAVFFLNRYCIRLPSDALTQLTPRFTIETDKVGTKYKCHLRLPINSGMRKTFSSEWESSVEAAKASVALNTLVELYNNQELNEWLEPITKELFYKQMHKPDEDDLREWSQFNHKSSSFIPPSVDSCYSNYMAHRPGGNKRKQTYRKKVSSYLYSNQLISTQKPACLYAINMTLMTPIINPSNLSKSPLSPVIFGLIASVPLLEIVDFPIYTQNGEELVHFDLVKTNLYLSPKQLKLVKTFHRFVFSNVLRMEGRGAAASPFLSDLRTSKVPQSAGCLVCILQSSSISSNYDFDWKLMESIDGCTDKSFMKIPPHAKWFIEEEDDEVEEDKKAKKNKEEATIEYKFDPGLYIDSVVIPYYRNSDQSPQFYCVSSIDESLKPYSPFPTSSHHQSNKPPVYTTFFQYFAYKYNIRITDLNQSLLIVSHPSTRLNLLTPRYMNMKAAVLQKSSNNGGQKETTAIKKSSGSHSSNQIYLVPELVNVHPLRASIWRRCMCLPSVLHRLNCLLLAEELRREIARCTGVGLPWVDTDNIKSFERLEFEWDANKESEMRNIPDLEIDLATLEHQKKFKNTNINSQMNNNSSNGNGGNQKTMNDVNNMGNADEDVFNNEINDDPKWNFEISEWDNSCLNELTLKQQQHTTTSTSSSNMFSFQPTYENESASGSEWNRWNDLSNCKTLFIDPNDMDDLFGNEFIDTDDEAMDHFDSNNENEKLESNCKSSQVNNKDEDDFDDIESSEEDEIENSTSNDATRDWRKSLKKKSSDLVKESSVEKNVKFTIDINTLKADMKRKSAKLLSKLTTMNGSPSNNNSSSLSLVKNLVKDIKTSEKSSAAELASLCSMISSSPINAAETTTDNNKLDLNKLYFLGDWFSRVQLRCESKNAEFNQKIDQLLAKFSNNKNSKIFEPIYIEPKQIDLPLKKRQAIIGDCSATNEMGPNLIKEDTNLTTSLRNTDWSFNFSLDDVSYPNELGPGPAIILQALTLSNAGDGFDLERLETVGDSFLKQAITVYLFFTYPNVNEGKLSFLRSKQVSNYNLYKLGKRKGLQELIISSKFEPLETWLPPHYFSSISTNTSSHIDTIFSSKSTANRFDKYCDHCVSDKSIADSVEAIIGAYLIKSGPQSALHVMSWFGLDVLPRVKCDDGSSHILVSLPEVPRPHITDCIKLQELLTGLDQFEAGIGYKFKQPVYLVQAFTHASYTANTITDCYQRLEFLGDAILDYIITRHLYEYKGRLSPGELTDLRSSLVNNNIFAYLAVKFEFYKYFKYTSPQIFTIIDTFVLNQKKRNDEFDLDEDFFDFPIDDDDEDDYFMMDETLSNVQPTFLSMLSQSNELEELEVPKCLGDIFESVAGAIYLDSNKSLDTVWRVYYGLMKPYIDKFTSKVPKSPIRELLELEPETIKFEKPERTIDGKIRVTVSVFGKGKFKGVGRNYRIAKNAAAKLALKFLKNQTNE